MLGFGVDFGQNKLLCIDFAKAEVREIKFLWRNQPINLLFVMIDYIFCLIKDTYW